MTDRPITPPPELLKQWEEVWFDGRGSRLNFDVLILEAFQAGADQELEACIEVIADHKWFANPYYRMAELRAARRPKPPNLKPMSELSPTAQAVIDAWWDASDGEYINGVWTPNRSAQLAAALIAAADQLTPYTVSEMEGAAFARNKLLAIAAELRGQDQQSSEEL